jgi:hypothetical protein
LAFSVSQSIGEVYGRMLHGLLQRVRWIEDFEFDETALRRAAICATGAEHLQKINLDRVLDEFSELLKLDSIRRLLSRARYQHPLFGLRPDAVEIDTERSVSSIEQGRIVRGSIDRLAILYSNGKPYAAEIIDFKTDAYDPSLTLLWLEERLEFHRPQLDAYARVVSRMFDLPLNRVASYLVMLSTGDVVRADRAIAAPHFHPHPSTYVSAQ